MGGFIQSFARVAHAARRAPRALSVVLAVALTAGLAMAAVPETTPGPVLGRSVTLIPVSGVTTYTPLRTHRIVDLRTTVVVPNGTTVNAERGRVTVTAAAGPSTGTTMPSAVSTALLYGGQFVVRQDRRAPYETHFTLSQHLDCPAQSASASGLAAAARAKARPSPVTSRHLWAQDTGGSFGTNGRYVSTTVEGTRWLTTDDCAESVVTVAQGAVAVTDLLHHRTVIVRAGQRYAAIAPALIPPPGTVYLGVTGGSASTFSAQTGKHAAVYGFFTSWDESLVPYIQAANAAHARLLLHISTATGYGQTPVISPLGIARGQGDRYLLSLNQALAANGRPAYVALMPEMNQTNNAYSAFNADGSSRGVANSTANYRQAWRRSVLIVRGGSVARINRRLRALRLPPVQGVRTRTLPVPDVGFLWAPQTAGTPATRANRPAAYYPGAGYVDLVGTDFYSKFPNFAGLTSLYNAYRSKPFGFNEWAMWVNGDPSFVDQFFKFVTSHRRVALAVYNQGLEPDGPFRLYRFPAARREIARRIASKRFPPYTPDWSSSQRLSPRGDPPPIRVPRDR